MIGDKFLHNLCFCKNIPQPPTNLIWINDFPSESTSSDGFECETFEKMCKLTKKISYLIIWELKDGTKKSTVNRYLAILKRLYNVAIEWGYAKENPVRHVKLFPENDNLMERILTHEEEDRLFEAASEHLRPILVVALNTGMRRGEILNLHWHQVDLYSKEIRVEKTKSRKSRVVDINSVLFKEFSRLKNERQNSPYVFPNPETGKPYKKLQTSFTGACRRAGIVGLRMHDLRHYAEFRTMPS